MYNFSKIVRKWILIYENILFHIVLGNNALCVFLSESEFQL